MKNFLRQLSHTQCFITLPSAHTPPTLMIHFHADALCPPTKNCYTHLCIAVLITFHLYSIHFLTAGYGHASSVKRKI